jgi:hypothetical protein
MVKHQADEVADFPWLAVVGADLRDGEWEREVSALPGCRSILCCQYTSYYWDSLC